MKLKKLGMRKAQTWSTDTVFAVVIFVFLLIFVFSFIGSQQRSQNVKEMQGESAKIPSILGSQEKENLSFIENDKVNKEKLATFANLSYEEIKQKLGLRYDFCIYFEDEEGRIINLTYGRPGLGSPNATLAGLACGLSSEQMVSCRTAAEQGSCGVLSGVTAAECCKYLDVCC